MAIIIAGCAVNNYGKYVNYEVTKTANATNPGSRILIVGTGTSGTNFFLDNLSDDLNRRLAQKNIRTFYFHLGNNQQEADRAFKKIVNENHCDAILHFAQVDETHNPIRLNQTPSGLPSNSGKTNMIYTRTIRYEQQFVLKYFELPDLQKTLIEANIGVKINTLNPNDYSEITEKIIRTLKLN